MERSDGRLLNTLEGHGTGELGGFPFPCCPLLSLATARIIASGIGRPDGSIRLWNESDGRHLRTLKGA